MVKIVETDNRDMNLTVLTIDIGEETYITVPIDPWDLFKNMIQNLPSPLDERFEWFLDVFAQRVEAEVELQSESEGKG